MATAKQNWKPEKWYWVAVAKDGRVVTGSFSETKNDAKNNGAKAVGLAAHDLAAKGYRLEKVLLQQVPK